ncbi:MAG TPA: hypothetical protein VMW72_09530 [Sedimentisphaerales bacterium]|nr:hypothetical protein [Sedimentisphaerales bacterium]
MKIELEFIEPLLGTLSGNPEIAEEFIAAKHPSGEVQEDEAEAIENLPEILEKSSTVFPRDEKGKLFIWDYQIKGFFKDACAAMIHSDAMKKEELKKFRLTEYLHKKTIDQLIFVSPRQIILQLPNSYDPNKIKFCERPLRGQTMRGERIALARSEQVPAGTKIIIDIVTLNSKLDEFIKHWLTYGALRGLGQWRNSGMGRFSWKEVQ